MPQINSNLNAGEAGAYLAELLAPDFATLANLAGNYSFACGRLLRSIRQMEEDLEAERRRVERRDQEIRDLRAEIRRIR